MSPKGLVALLLVGLCATQVSASFRGSREVEELLDSAQDKLEGELANQKDAARSSMETVMGFLQKMEADVLRAASDKLEALGFPIDLVVISELIKSNVNECVTNDAVKATTQSVISDVSSCITKDSEKLKDLMSNMQGLWNTAMNIPGGMRNVATQCSEHGEHDIPEDAILEVPKDVSDHDLAPVVNDILDDAAQTRTKRWLWGLGRITRCVKSVYSLARNDLITIPGQILSTASNAYGVVTNAANSVEIPKCVQEKATTTLPVLKDLAVNVGTCMSEFDLDEIMAGNPKLAGLKKTVDLAMKLAAMPSSALGGASAALGNLASDVANGGITGAASGVVGRFLG